MILYQTEDSIEIEVMEGEDMSDISIKFTKIVENYNLTNHTPGIDTDRIMITIPEVNRPALQLARRS